MKKRFSFGKIDFTRTGRKEYPVTVDVELRQRGGDAVFTMKGGIRHYTGKHTPKYWELSICGDIWNTKHTDIVCGGQCLDTIAEFVNDPLFCKLYRWWKKYHLNGMHAGTPAQERALKKFHAETGERLGYETDCAYLKELGLLEVTYTGKTVGRMYKREPYKYGSAWIVREIPASVLKEIMKLLEEE